MTTQEKYTPVRIGLHWAMLLLLVAVYATIELRVLYPKGSLPREAMKAWHFMLGLTVLASVALRLLTAAFQPGPDPVEGPRWQRQLAKLMHGVLYGLMIGMPLLGWLVLSLEGKSIPYFGLEVPALTGVDKPLAKQVEDIHVALGTVGYVLVGLHATAALFHHYVIKDRLMRRMSPWA